MELEASGVLLRFPITWLALIMGRMSWLWSQDSVGIVPILRVCMEGYRKKLRSLDTEAKGKERD